MEHLYELAIIGAGPAGIATAIESYAVGMRDIILLEKATEQKWAPHPLEFASSIFEVGPFGLGRC